MGIKFLSVACPTCPTVLLTFKREKENKSLNFALMTAEKVQKLSLIFRQVRDVVKHSIDDITELAENALQVLSDSDAANQKALPPMESDNRLLNRKQIAQRLNISPRKVSNLQTEGLPVVQIGRRILFDCEEVLLWIKGKEVKERGKSKLRVVS